MEYFAGLDVSLEKTHVCVLDRTGTVVFERAVVSSPGAILSALNEAPSCERVVFETGRMAPMLYHGLADLGVPVVCIESRQAYQALKTLATHKTDRNDARGLAQLARTGFFKPVHVKSLPAHAVRALIMARKKLVGQRVTLENQIRGLAVVFGARLPRGLSPAFVEQVITMSDGIAGLSAAMRGLVAARDAVLYEAANVMLTRYKGELKLKDWAFAIAKRSNMRKARIALARRLAIIMHAMLRHGTEFKPA